MSRNASSSMPNGVLPRLNVLDSALQPAPVGQGPTTGFFRNNYCDASPLDPGSHTVAALVSPSFLSFSASRGNDLRPLFPRSGQNAPENGGCVWCLCASRWLEALKAARNGHEQGDAIVPKVFVEATHTDALRIIDKEDLLKYAVGGTGHDGQGGQQKVFERPGR